MSSDSETAARNTIATAALTDPVEGREVRRFAAELRSGRPTPASDIVAYVLGAGVLAFVAVVLGMLLTWLAGLPAGAVLVTVVVVALVASTILVTGRIRRGVRVGQERRYRLARFAEQNGFTYRDRVPAHDLPGLIFRAGGSRLSTDVVTQTSPHHIEYGHHQFTTRNGKHTLTHHWGYVAMRLDRALPHLLLDAVGNNSVLGSNLPMPFSASQRLSLEGDFDRHFRLHCPAGYERDALYLFAPDVMARFVDDAAQFDVEVIDDWLFLYTQRAVTTLDPATWTWLFDTTAALRRKTAQWERWRDDRLTAAPAPGIPAPALPTPPVTGVAASGRRLKRGRGALWLAAAAVAVGLLVVVLEVF